MTPSFALIDTDTGILFTISTHPSPILFLHDFNQNTSYVPHIEYPNHLKDTHLTTLQPKDYPKWTWVRSNRKFVETRSDIDISDMQNAAVLLSAQRDAIASLIFNINVFRQQLDTGFYYQDFIYLAKLLEAQSSHEDEASLPYLKQYADYKDISKEEAARAIGTQAKLSERLLIESESLRLKYSDEIRLAKRPEELLPITQRFTRDIYRRMS